jgi:hypothetical protein
MYALRGERYGSYLFLSSTVDGVSGQRHAPAALYPQGKNLCAQWIGCWVGLKACLDTEVNRFKMLTLFKTL